MANPTYPKRRHITLEKPRHLSSKVTGWVGSFGVGQRRWEVRGVSFDDAFRVLVRGAAVLASGHAALLGAATAPTP